ncbi:MAG: sulfurtransferase FdhD [Desulfobulbus propionicus]|nr:MAG: sulfurtransferase FdhD [Desulfobulbus propionicus]
MYDGLEHQVTLAESTVVVTPHGREERLESVAIEVPYTVSLNERDIGSSMVLETGLEEFGAGFLFGQGYIDAVGQVREVLVCPEGRISVYADVDEDAAPKEVIITSGCGGTGKISREMLEGAFDPLQEYCLPFGELQGFIRQVLQASPLGPRTHCVHGCGFWVGGQLAAFQEDVGRHNAVDKIIGGILLGRYPAAGAVYTTGRLTSDMVLKCARIGIPVVMSRTAPSSLGLAIARRAGVTLVAYVRGDRLNIFNAPERILTT